MNGRADRDRRQGECIPRFDLGLGPAHDGLPYAQPNRREYISFLTVCVLDQGYASRATRVILDGYHLAGDINLVSLEIDVPQHALHAATPMSNRHFALIIAPGLAPAENNERLLRLFSTELLKGNRHLVSPAR